MTLATGTFTPMQQSDGSLSFRTNVENVNINSQEILVALYQNICLPPSLIAFISLR